MAVSRRKLAANRQNSGRSTGPRTPEGKRRVRFNALRHGLLAKEVIVPIGDEQEHSAEWERLLNERWQDYTPVGRIGKHTSREDRDLLLASSPRDPGRSRPA